MYSLGLHMENIGGRPKSSQSLPRLQNDGIIYHQIIVRRYMYIAIQLHDTPPPPPPPQKKKKKKNQSFCFVHQLVQFA